MSVWFKKYNIEDFQWMAKNTMAETLGMELLEIGGDFLTGRLPIDNRTIQYMRLLHGGASVALAETLGSVASFMIIDPETQICVGQSIQASHIRAGKKGFATGKVSPIHIGRSSHIWNVDIVDDEGKLLSTCRLTMAIIDKPSD